MKIEFGAENARDIRRATAELAGGTAALCVVFVTLLIVATYTRYLPPDFRKGFLIDRDSYFFRTPYGVGFYAHILASPIAVICGAIQFNSALRRRAARIHRIAGRIYVLCVLLFAAPGGFIMAFGTRGGASSSGCFLVMSVSTWFFTWQAWKTAKRREFAAHRRWMWRSYLMIVSAILLRVIDPALRQSGVPELLSYQICVWLSWVPSLALFEILHRWGSVRQVPV
jgi:uncharacterized membrane protein